MNDYVLVKDTWKLDDAIPDHPEAPISERSFEQWMLSDPLAQAIIANDHAAVLALADNQPEYIKKRLAEWALRQGLVADTSPAALRNAARRLAIKQAKARS